MFKKQLHKWVLTILFLLSQFSGVGYCQKKISFQNLRDGLSNYHIKSIFQDSKGFMWFGTFDGLNKYDGSQFVIYENSTQDSTSISDNFINAIVEDKYGNMWIGTSNGINMYDRNNDNFKRPDSLLRYRSAYITSLFIDELDNLWIGTAGIGLAIYNINTQKLETYRYSPENINSISSNFISGVAVDKYKRVWVGARYGLNLYDYMNKKFVRYYNDKNNTESISNDWITTIKSDNSGDVWIGTYGGGLNKLIDNTGNISFKRYTNDKSSNCLSNNFVLSIKSDRNGNLWIGTENGGLNCLELKTGIFTHFYSEVGNPDAIASNSIWSIYEDNNGILWIGTYNKGVNIYDKNFKKFELFQKNNTSNRELTSNIINSFVRDKTGKIWIGTDGGGICGFDPKSRNFFDFPGNNKISSPNVINLLIDSKGNFWVGTWSYGVDKFDSKGGKIKNYKCTNQNVIGANTWCFLEDSKGNIWVGTLSSGLYKYDSTTDEFNLVTDESIRIFLNSNSYIGSIIEDFKGNIWVGTYYGLVCLIPLNDGNYKYTPYLHSNNNPHSLSNSQIRSLLEDSKHQIWVGTNNGLNLMVDSTGTFIRYYKENGLPNNCINSILEDKNHNIWLGTNNGLSEFNPLKNSFTNYVKEDGLNSNEFTAGACIKLESGEILFGGPSGFNMFNPQQIKTNKAAPLVYLTKLKISNNEVKIGDKGSPLTKSITEIKKITLTHKQSSFSLEFVALNYTRSAKNSYKYMLQGFDKTWVNSGSQHSATYTNLNAGNYVFKVMGSNNDGVLNIIPCELEIVVLPPFWKTTWAYLIYILVIGILLYSFLRLWMIKTVQAQKLKYEKIQREHEDELNKLKIQFFTNVSHELRTPLTLIISPLEHIISSENITGKLKQQLSLVFKNSQRLFRLVNELMDFSKFEEKKLKLFVKQFDLIKFTQNIFYLFTDEARQKQITYTFEPQISNVTVWADQDKLEKVILNLLANAFKYTPDSGFIKIVITNSEISDSCKIDVINSGLGISSDHIDKIFDRFYQVPENEANTYSGTGIGLALVKNIIDLHHGKISVTSEVNKQTCFSVLLNLGKEHFTENDIIDVAQVNKTRKRNSNSLKNSEDNELENNKSLVLVVEDNQELRAYLSSVLNEEYEIIEAFDGEMGLTLAIERNPDLIISDIIMPKLSGIELCKKIKENIDTSHIPVVLLTSKSNIESQIEGIETGADSYITKPFNVAHIRVIVRKLIEMRRKLFQRFSQEVYLLPKEISTNKYDQKFLEQTIDYINKNIENEDISVEGLSTYLSMNRSNVYRKIKSLTGQSATEFIRTMRLKMAIKYLEAGDMNISEICYKVGFTSPAYFTKCFKEQFGKLPSDFISKKATLKTKN